MLTNLTSLLKLPIPVAEVGYPSNPCRYDEPSRVSGLTCFIRHGREACVKLEMYSPSRTIDKRQTGMKRISTREEEGQKGGRGKSHD